MFKIKLSSPASAETMALKSLVEWKLGIKLPISTEKINGDCVIEFETDQSVPEFMGGVFEAVQKLMDTEETMKQVASETLQANMRCRDLMNKCDSLEQENHNLRKAFRGAFKKTEHDRRNNE